MFAVTRRNLFKKKFPSSSKPKSKRYIKSLYTMLKLGTIFQLFRLALFSGEAPVALNVWCFSLTTLVWRKLWYRKRQDDQVIKLHCFHTFCKPNVTLSWFSFVSLSLLWFFTFYSLNFTKQALRMKLTPNSCTENHHTHWCLTVSLVCMHLSDFWGLWERINHPKIFG